MYQAVADHVQDLLKGDPEWIARYAAYAKTLSENEKRYRFAAERFYVPGAFGLYMSLSDAVNACNPRTTVFELRYGGQSVAKLRAPSEKKSAVELVVAKEHGGFQKGERMEWSEGARGFRKVYEDMLERGEWLPGQPEHRLESELLQNFSLKSLKGKTLPYVQPVMLKGTNARFQMPTPITASNAKKGISHIEYSKHHGGGIDILARVGRGNGTTLAVMELKDDAENRAERPEMVMKQAVAYATFIRELLRSESGTEWWHFFGFGGELPKALKIKAVVVMPNSQYACQDFGFTELPLGGDDVIVPGYVYLARDAYPQISNI